VTASLAGRSAIVSGAAGGLGRACAEALLGAGAHVVLCDVRTDVVEVARSLAGPTRALGIVANLARDGDVTGVVDAALAAFGRLDTLVANAAVWRRTPVTDDFAKALADWDAIVTTNLRGTLMLARASVPHIVAAGGGDVVLIGSNDVLPARDAHTNNAETDIYNATQWALNGFVQAWALALARKQVRVNALCPGCLDTPMLRAQIEAGIAASDVARLQPAAVAALLVALLDEGPAGRTGENIGAWPGEAVVLGPRTPAHRAVTG